MLSGSQEATALLFDPQRADGAHLDLVRLPLTATDFSTQGWTFGWNDATGDLSAPGPAFVSTAFIADTLRALRPELRTIAVPWTAPAVMKDSNALNGGSLLAGSVDAYARQIVAQADWLAGRGVGLMAMSLGNEPFHAATGPGGYPTMLISDEQMIALAVRVAPGLASRGVVLWAVDHNWEHRSHYDSVLAGAPGSFAAAAFHCYGGDPSQMAGVAVPAVVTECTGTNDGFDGTFRWDALNLVVQAVRAGSTGLLMWNLALNEAHGPHTGGCSTCRGVVDVDSTSGAVTRNPEFFTLAHLSRAASPGAVVIGSADQPGLPYVAFRNPDGRIGVFGYNDTGAAQVVAASLDGVRATQSFRVEPGNLFTLRGWSQMQPPAVSLSGDTPIAGLPERAQLSGGSPTPTSASYQWFADGVPIAGATDSVFTPGAQLAGARLSATVRVAAPGYEPLEVMSGRAQPVVVDSTPPSASVSPLPTFTRSSSLAVSWIGSDAQSSVSSFDVRWRRAAWNSGFGSWGYPTSWQRTAARAAGLSISRGFTYCFSVRARDKVGNTSGWSSQRCSATLLDDTALVAGSGWTRRSSVREYWLGTYTATGSRGRSLSRPSAQLTRIALLVTKCSSCGRVSVYLGSTLLATVDLHSSSTLRQQFVVLPPIAPRMGTIKLLTSSTLVVQVDGVGISRA